MPTPTSRAAYKVQYDILDRALDSPSGIRIGLDSKGEARAYSLRLHAARSLDRQLNQQSRELGDPKYGVSDYDNLIVRIRPDESENKWWVYVERNVEPDVIEELRA